MPHTIYSHKRPLEEKEMEGRSMLLPEIGNKAIEIDMSSSKFRLTRNAKIFERSRTYGTADPCA
jgi:hypothetical protein